MHIYVVFEDLHTDTVLKLLADMDVVVDAESLIYMLLGIHAL